MNSMRALTIKVVTISISLTLLNACLVIDSSNSIALAVPLNEVSDTQVKILDSRGAIIHEGKTPNMATMKPSDNYLDRSAYSIVFTTPGYIERSFTIHSSSLGTYYENVPNLRPMGILVLNSKTGALFQIDKETIQPDQSGKIATERRNDFEIYTLDQLPSEWKSLLYPLN